MVVCLIKSARVRVVIIVCAIFGLVSEAVGQSLDFQNTIYYTVSGTGLTSSGETLSAFDFGSAGESHPLFNEGLYYPVSDALNRNLWIRVRHIAADPNGIANGHSVTQSSGSPFRSGGFGGWGGFLYQFDIFRDSNLTGTRSGTLGATIRTSITVESIETLSDTEWVLFEIIEDPTVTWSLNSINFTGANPASNPGFSGTNIPYNGTFAEVFPAASNTICVVDGAGGGYSEFSMTAVGVSRFLYGYEYISAGGYQGMTLSFGTLVLLPTITGFTPQSGAVGTEVVISGTNFSAQPSNNIVTINGVPVTVIASTATTLTILIPEGALSGLLTVTVDENSVTSEEAFIVPPPEVEPVPDIVVYNAVSPNGDGRNDVFLIANIAELPQNRRNKVVIINRWGDVVFSVSDYDNVSRVFTGVSSAGHKLPPGVYYYRIDIPETNRQFVGYILLKN
jgi:gliding motility-associated-like protein